MSKSLSCPMCKQPLVRGEGTCQCGGFYFTGRIKGPSRGGQLRVASCNYYCELGGAWQLIDWGTKDVRGGHEQTPTNGRVTCCACCAESGAADVRSLPGGWTGGRY